MMFGRQGRGTHQSSLYMHVRRRGSIPFEAPCSVTKSELATNPIHQARSRPDQHRQPREARRERRRRRRRRKRNHNPGSAIHHLSVQHPNSHSPKTSSLPTGQTQQRRLPSYFAPRFKKDDPVDRGEVEAEEEEGIAPPDRSRRDGGR